MGKVLVENEALVIPTRLLNSDIADWETVVNRISAGPLRENEGFSAIAPVIFKGTVSGLLVLSSSKYEEIPVAIVRQLSRVLANALEFAEMAIELESAKESLKEKDKVIGKLIETTFVAVFYANKDLLLQDCNKKFEEIAGISKIAILGKRIEEVLPEFASCISERDTKLETKRDQQYQFSVNLNQEAKHFLVRKFPVLDSEGGVSGIVGVMIEITESKEIEVSKIRNLLLQVIDLFPDPAFVVDEERRVVAWNHAIESLTGVSAESIVGKGNY